MPILVDFNQVAISNLMIAVNTYNKGQEINEDLVRHMILNSIRGYNVKFGKKYGAPVICCDGRNYWRKEVFPYYKASRSKTRSESTMDWGAVFEILNTIRDEIKDHFPYVVLDLDRTEADDIIAVLAQNKDPFEPMLILSGDKDFMQLQKHVYVDQYAPVQKKFLRTADPEGFLKEHIIRGDTSDGIPNYLSGDTSLVMGVRQTPIMAKKVAVWMKESVEDFCKTPDKLRGYRRNEMLIDLDKIPEDIADAILKEYASQMETAGDRSRLFNYFISKRLKLLMDCIQEF